MISGVSSDQITERRRVAEEFRRSKEELADFFENATVGLLCVGPDGTILQANRAELEEDLTTLDAGSDLRRDTVLALIPVRRAISFVPSSALPSESASSTASARPTAATCRTAGCPVLGIGVRVSAILGHRCR